MMQNPDDLRIRRTRKLLQRALLEVTSEKGFARVTIGDISKRAMVNRATFYRHYKDKYDLLQQYSEELSGIMDAGEGEIQAGAGVIQSPDAPPIGLVKLLRHMRANADFYRVMLGRQGDPSFCEQSFRSYIERGFKDILSRQVPRADPCSPPMDLIVNYIMQAGLGAIVWWLENSQATSPEQMAAWLFRLSMGSINASLAVGKS